MSLANVIDNATTKAYNSDSKHRNRRNRLMSNSPKDTTITLDPVSPGDEDHDNDAQDSGQEDGPAEGNPAGGLAHAGAVDRRVAAHRTEDFS